MKSLFFNAEPSSDIVANPTGYDREYDSDDHASFFAPFFNTAGVMAGTNANACKIIVKTGAVLGVTAGCAYVKGRMVQFDGTEEITITKACKIVARMNKTADVRAFQLLAVDTLVQTEDVYDLQLADASLRAISVGYEATVVDTRTFMAFTGQPPYYPPNSDSLPYVLWLYTLGYPMTAAQRASVTENPSLMAIYNASLGAIAPAVVSFTAAQWATSGAEKNLTLPRTQHGRQSGKFSYTLRMLVNGVLKENTWGAKCTDVAYDANNGNIVLSSADAYSGEISFCG